MVNLEIGDKVIYESIDGRLKRQINLEVYNVCDFSGIVSTKQENGFPFIELHFSELRRVSGGNITERTKQSRGFLSFLLGS